jgi:hypothetical protein
MGERKRQIRVAAGLLLLSATASACTTTRTMLAPHPPAQYTRLGPAQGEGCSAIVPLLSYVQVVPVATEGRFRRAYAAAVASVPGATALIDVSFQEHWYWAVFGTVYCTRITGEAVR